MQTAVSLIEKRLGKIQKITKILENSAVEFASSNIFCNIALFFHTNASPVSVLKTVKEIERNMGRERDSKASGGYSDRMIDIDIVSYGAVYFESENLVLPHKKHLEREFSKKLLRELLN